MSEIDEKWNLDWSKCANDYVIDVRKRGKSQDITDKKFKISEPKMNE